jgi:hypothetical protein
VTGTPVHYDETVRVEVSWPWDEVEDRSGMSILSTVGGDE